jgi:type I restriction enzyme S subunit
MSKSYPMIPLAEVLTQYQEYIDAPEPKIYPKLSVKLYGKGVVLDVHVDGSSLKMQKHQIAKGGQVILSEIWGKKGAIGFVPSEGDGALCTSHFFLFDICPDVIEPKYLQAIFTANYLQDQLDIEAKGTTGYAAVRPRHLLAAQIPLPPLEEQRRVVARIEELAAKIQEARGLRKQLREDCNALCRSILADTSDGTPTLTPMRELVRLREPDITVSPGEIYWFAGVYSFGRGLFQGQRRTGAEFAYTRLTHLRTGNFVYPKLMAWEGAFAVVPTECNGLVVSPEFPVFEIDQQRVLPETLDVYFRMPSVWSAASGASTGTNVRRRRLNPADFLTFEIPLPPMKTQKRLREVKAKLDQISQLQSEAATELEALLPSILDKAFKGEL